MNYIELMDWDIPVAAVVIRYENMWSIEQFNVEFARLLGYGEEAEVSVSGDSFVLDKDRCLLEETMEQALRTKKAVPQEIRIVQKDGTSHWVEVRCRLLAHVNATPYLMLILWDVHERKNLGMHLQLINQKYELMEQLSHEYPFDVDVASWTMLRSHRLMELCGNYEAEDAYYPVNEEVLTLSPQDQKIFLEALQDAALVERSGSIDTRFNVSTEEDAPKYVWLRTFYKSIADEDGHIVRIIGRSFNVNTDKQLQEEVRRDPLTKLLNKMETQREVMIYLDERSSGKHAMLLIDIDNFKGVNDNFGHTFGDTVLTDVANIIRGQFRMNDIVGRVGGDEFLVLMKDTTLEKAVEKAQRLCNAASKDYTGGGINYHISISVGLALYGEDGNSYSELFEKADHAMYRAKQRGKNTYELANPSDMGPIRDQTKTIERREKMMGQGDQGFLAFAASLMAHARNLEGSLNMLLKRIAERYDLDLVAVFEHNDSKTESVMTNYYGSEYLFYAKSSIPIQKDSDIDKVQPGNYGVFTSAQLAAFKGSYALKTAQQLDPDQHFSVVLVKYEYATERTGQIIYLSLNEERQWQPNELEMMQELTRTISIFISLRYRMEESEAQIRHIQKRDQLTDLYNQEAFKQKALSLLKDAPEDKSYAFEYLDIDNFGYVNENYGYKIGDNILKMLAEDLSAQEYFVLGSRLYSDFFLLLLEGKDRESLEENIRSRNQRFLNMLNHQYPNSGMGITAGVYILEDMQKVDLDVAVENAILAWKHAKNGGLRDAVFFEPWLRITRAEELHIIGEFFEALYRNDFQLYLQPKFILGERSVYGAEALSRWKRTDGTILSPGAYIDSLERIGYITELDFYIFEELLRTMESWKQQDKRGLIVSTNFSGRHFEGDGEEFLSRVAHMISRYDVSPSNIEIEVTEGVLIRNLETLRNCIEKLHEMGFRVAIDDFGTGYSSLSVLADVPADVIKIDKTFINRNMTDSRLILLYEIGRMVKIMGKDIIIEGVETEEQETFLSNGGFRCGQGYLCNPPIPVGEFEKAYL